MTDNVVLFPGFKRESPPQTIEEITDKVTQTRKEHVEGVMIDLVPDTSSIRLDLMDLILIQTNT